MNTTKYLYKIFKEVESLPTEILISEGAPFLFRLFSFIIKENSGLFKIIYEEENLYTCYLRNHNKIIYRFNATAYSCNRFIIDKHSKLYIKSGVSNWLLFNFNDLEKLLVIVNKEKVGFKKDTVFNVGEQMDKVIQQTKYFIFISRCANVARKQLARYCHGENSVNVLLLNPKKRLGTFLLTEAFGVTFGHIDHPTPYPYSSELQQNLLGGDPFLSFYRVMDKILQVNDKKLVTLSKKIFIRKDESSFSYNGIRLVLIPKYYFSATDILALENHSYLLAKTVKFVHGNKIKYDQSKFFVLFIPMIENNFINNRLECSLPKDCSLLPYNLLGFSTSSGRSMIVPIVSDGKDDCLYIKTSWPDIVKTAQNRGLSPSKIQWFKICNEIYKSFSSKYFEFQFEQQFCPNNNKDNLSKYLSFLIRDFSVLRRNKDEIVLPLIGIVVPNHPYPVDDNLLLSLVKASKRPKLFIKKLIFCVTDAIIHQLLNKGVFHSLHLQNCSILFKKNTNGLMPKLAIMRDGDIRMCCDYSSMLTSREIGLINILKKKRGKFISKTRFYKQLFHNIINENFGNIEQCLMADKKFDSEWFWGLVITCFKDSLFREINELKRKKQYKKIHKQIVADFERKMFYSSGYALNFFQMGFFGAKENFVKVVNPLKNYLEKRNDIMNLKNASNTLIYNNKSILLGRRKKAPFTGMWSLPGGHLKKEESITVCAERELFEEIGLSLKSQKLFFVSDETTITDKYRHHFFYKKTGKSIIKYYNNEPNNFEEWRFFPIEKLPDKIFRHHKKAIDYFIKNFV